MTKFNKPLNEILIEDFLPSLKGDGIFTKQQFVDWLEDYYPGFADSTATNWLTRLTTNSVTRLNWPIRKGKDDILFKIGETSAFRLFDKSNDAPPIYLATEYLFSRIMRRCGELGIPYKTVIGSHIAVREGWTGGKVQYRDGENGTVGWGDKKERISGKHTSPHSFEEMLTFLGLYYDSSTNQYHHQSQGNSASSSILINEKLLARHFLVYWKPEQISKVLKEGLLSKAASNQFSTIKPDDTLWICGYNAKNILVTVGFVLVDQIIGQDEANRRFPELKWEAKFYACAQTGKEISTREVSIASIIPELSFISSSSTHLDEKTPLGNQLQRKRELTLKSAQLLSNLWSEFEQSDSEHPIPTQDISEPEKLDNHSIARIGMAALKNEIEKLGGQNLKVPSPSKRNILEFDSPGNLRMQLRVKTMTKGGWQASIKDADSNPEQEKSKFWVFIEVSQLSGHKKFYIAPEHWVKKDIFVKHREYLDRNNGARVSGADSNHHSIKPERVSEWESRWDLLGLNINVEEIQRPDYDDEAELAYTDLEGRIYLKTHLFRERSSKCVSAFKRSLKSFECSLCGFDFEKAYGEVGRGFIEAHHIIPVATAGEREVRIEDYRAVCSNCHRMIHRIYPKVLTNLQGGK